MVDGVRRTPTVGTSFPSEPFVQAELRTEFSWVHVSTFPQMSVQLIIESRMLGDILQGHSFPFPISFNTIWANGLQASPFHLPRSARSCALMRSFSGLSTPILSTASYACAAFSGRSALIQAVAKLT